MRCRIPSILKGRSLVTTNMVVTYNGWLVTLSYLIAVVASFTALELGSRVTQSTRRAARVWLIGGAFAMGVGIWSMHFVGMLKMDDEAGGDAKILAVPVDKLSSLYRSIESPHDLPEIQLAQIAHFFAHYKDLEPGKWVRISGWVGADEAKEEIVDCVRRYVGADPKPSF